MNYDRMKRNHETILRQKMDAKLKKDDIQAQVNEHAKAFRRIINRKEFVEFKDLILAYIAQKRAERQGLAANSEWEYIKSSIKIDQAIETAEHILGSPDFFISREKEDEN